MAVSLAISLLESINTYVCSSLIIDILCTVVTKKHRNHQKKAIHSDSILSLHDILFCEDGPVRSRWGVVEEIELNESLCKSDLTDETLFFTFLSPNFTFF